MILDVLPLGVQAVIAYAAVGLIVAQEALAGLAYHTSDETAERLERLDHGVTLAAPLFTAVALALIAARLASAF